MIDQNVYYLNLLVRLHLMKKQLSYYGIIQNLLIQLKICIIRLIMMELKKQRRKLFGILLKVKNKIPINFVFFLLI
jgi:hypothetical protein